MVSMWIFVMVCSGAQCPRPYSTKLYFTLLYCTLLYFTELYWTVLYCIVLYCTVFYCIYCALHCIVMYCSALYRTVQYSVLPPLLFWLHQSFLLSICVAGGEGRPYRQVTEGLDIKTRWGSPNRQNPPIQQNWHNFWINDAILISFKI